MKLLTGDYNDHLGWDSRIQIEASQCLAKARAGQRIEITSHRKVIARVVGLPEEPVWAKQHPAMWRLVQSGQATWSGEKPKFARIKLPGGDKTISEMVLEDRD